MNNLREVINDWFKKRSERDKFYLFLLGLILIYASNFIFILHPLSHKKTELLQSVAALQLEKQTLQQKIDAILLALKNPIFVQKIAEQKRLSKQLNNLENELTKLKPKIFTSKEFPNLTKDVLRQKNNNVTLVSLVELPGEIWPPETLVDKTDLLKITAGNVYQHTLKIEFQDDYFGTIAYLKMLEKLPWYIFWDNLEYKVLQYPKADVIINFHILSIQKS